MVYQVTLKESWGWEKGDGGIVESRQDFLLKTQSLMVVSKCISVRQDLSSKGWKQVCQTGSACSAGGWHQVEDNVHREQWASTWSEHSTIGGKQWLAEF